MFTGGISIIYSDCFSSVLFPDAVPTYHIHGFQPTKVLLRCLWLQTSHWLHLWIQVSFQEVIMSHTF